MNDYRKTTLFSSFAGKCALFIFLALTIIFTSSCDDLLETTKKEYSIDPSGYTYTIVCDTGADDTLAPRENDPIGDKLISRYNEIMKDLNCSIKTEIMSTNKIKEKVQAGAVIGGKFADLVQTRASTIYSMALTDYLSPLESVPELETHSQKWGLESQRDFLKINGKSYGFYGLWLSTSFPTVSGTVLYNKNIFDTFYLTDPQEFYEQNLWNWDSFSSLSRSATYIAEDDSSTYGFITPNSKYSDMIYAALTSNGVSRFIQTEMGENRPGYNCYEAIYTLDWLKSMIVNDKVSYDLKMGFDNGYLDVLAFTNGRTAFLITNSYAGVCGNSDFPMETFYDKLGWIAFPIGPYYNKETVPSYFSGNDIFNAIATTREEDLYKGAMILDRIFDPLDGEDENSWKRIMMDNYFFDQKSCDLYIDMLNQAEDIGLLTFPEYNDRFSEKLVSVVVGEESATKALIEIEGILLSE